MHVVLFPSLLNLLLLLPFLLHFVPLLQRGGSFQNTSSLRPCLVHLILFNQILPTPHHLTLYHHIHDHELNQTPLLVLTWLCRHRQHGRTLFSSHLPRSAWFTTSLKPSQFSLTIPTPPGPLPSLLPTSAQLARSKTSSTPPPLSSPCFPTIRSSPLWPKPSSRRRARRSSTPQPFPPTRPTPSPSSHRTQGTDTWTPPSPAALAAPSWPL